MITKQLLVFLNENKVIANNQSGFRPTSFPGLSCEDERRDDVPLDMCMQMLEARVLRTWTVELISFLATDANL